MKRWVIPLAALVAALTAAAWWHTERAGSRAGFPAPDFALLDLSGTEYRLSSLRGKVVLLNLWTTWCAPCREEMPSMEILHRRLAGQEFVVLAVNQDADGQTAAKAFVNDLGITFPVLIDPRGEVSRKFGVTGYPETFIIDRNGKVLVRHIGFQNWADDRVQAMLRQLIAASRDETAPPA